MINSTLKKGLLTALFMTSLVAANAQICVTQWAPDLAEGKAFSSSKVVIMTATSTWAANSSEDVPKVAAEFTKTFESTAKRVGFQQVFPDYSGQDGLRIATNLQTLRAEVLGTLGELFMYNVTGSSVTVRQTMPIPHPVHPEYAWLAEKLGTPYVMFTRASQYSDNKHVMVTAVVDLRTAEVVARNLITSNRDGHKHINHYTYLALSEITTKSR